MRATKRYSRSTKKKAIDTEKDPYLSRYLSRNLSKIGPKGRAVCKKCLAVYSSKRWSLPSERNLPQKGLTGTKALKKIVCPACQKIKDNFALGYVTLKGGFVASHNEELVNLMKNTEARAMSNNPLDRIMSIKKGRAGLVVTTTTEKLAQRLGRILHKAFSGKVEYKWGGEQKSARVTWTRER